MEYLYDPLRRKKVAATPEEEVRQWFIVQLRDCFGVPMHMMMSEAGMTLGAKSYRADILVYGRDARPLAVVECKRPEVTLSQETALQAMRYHSVLKVKFIFLTNGNLTYIYRLEGGSFVPCREIPRYEAMLAFKDNPEKEDGSTKA